MLLRKEKGWDTRLCNACLSNQGTINTDLSSNSCIKSFMPLDFFRVKVDFIFCILKRCILVHLLALYIGIFFLQLQKLETYFCVMKS